MDRLDDSFVRRGDERRTTMDNNTDMMAGCLAKLNTAFKAVASSGFLKG